MTSIYINARFLTQPVTGVQRYALELIRAIDALYEAGDEAVAGLSLELVAPRSAVAPRWLKHIPVRRTGYLRGHAWEQLELPTFLGASPLVSLGNTGPAYKHKQSLTLHDASVFAFPAAFSLPFRSWYHFLLPRLGKRVEQIITISEFSKRELMHYCGIPEDKFTIIYQGSEQILRTPSDEAILERHELREKPYVLAVGSANPNKNVENLVKAALYPQLAHTEFVWVGTEIDIFRASKNLSERVKQPGYVSDAELRALYENAACYVLPSLYEGFGLTPLEAMACGCPVVVANAASLPEVCGDAALYCNPHEPEDIAGKVARVLKDVELQKTLRTRGYERSQKFTWLSCARQTLQIIRTLA